MIEVGSNFDILKRLSLRSAGPLSVAIMVAATGANAQVTTADTQLAARNADEFRIVDCLLPGQLRKLGRRATYVTARRPIKTSIRDCQIRGGEYVAEDRGSYAHALKVWLPKAKSGDPEAQTFVGEIFEKGLGLSPNYQTAAVWYGRAAKQGFSTAQINLGSLYEKGLGVPRNPKKALEWYRRASGLDTAGLAFVSAGQVNEVKRLRQEAAVNRRQTEGLRGQVQKLKGQLEQTRRQLKKRRGAAKAKNRRLNKASRQLSAERARVAKSRRTLEAERKRLASLEDEYNQRLTTVKQADRGPEISEQAKQAQRAKLEREQAKAAKLADQLKNMREKLARRETGVATRRELEAERKRLRDLEAEQARRLKAVETARKKAESERRAEQERLKSQQAKAAQLEEELKNLRKKLKGRKAGVATRRELEAERERLRDLEAEHADRLKAVEAARKMADAGRRAERARLKRQQAKAERLQKQVKQLHKQLSDRKVGVATRRELEAERKRLHKVEREYAERLKAVETARRKSESGRRMERVNLDRERAKVAILQKKLKKSRKNLGISESRLSEQSGKLTAREKEISKKRDELAKLNRELKRLSTEAKNRRTQLASLNTGSNNSKKRSSSGAPEIEIIDPKIVVTRGVPIVRTRGNLKTRVIVGRVASSAGLMTLVVNDREQKFDKEGLFKTSVPIRPGGTKVSIVAIDRRGKKRDLEFVLQPVSEEALVGKIVSSATPPPLRVPKVDFGKFYALVIGSNKYRTLPKLETAVDDAKAVSEILTKSYGFKVKLLLNATRYEMLSALNEMRKKLTKKDNFLLYYAGHGELDKVNQRGHWLPVDAEPTSTANWISNISITDVLNAINARHVMVVADSCYSGSLTRSALARLEAGMSAEARATWVKTIVKKRSRMAMTSGGLQPVLDAGGGKHSIFAKAFIDVLKNNKGIVEARRIHQDVAARVAHAADAYRYDQLPEYAPIKHAGHGGGEFFFVPKKI